MPIIGSPIHNMTSAQLQSTLSASTSGGEQPNVFPHHPISCSTTTLSYHEDDSMECGHVRTPAKDPRTASCVRHSVVLLLIEPAVSDLTWRYKSPEDLIEEWNKAHPNDPW